GIRDRNVTGVQTCALPICGGRSQRDRCRGHNGGQAFHGVASLFLANTLPSVLFQDRWGDSHCKLSPCALPFAPTMSAASCALLRIGRASCRERVELCVVAA